MSVESLVPCHCCKDKTPTSRLRYVRCLVGYVCRECRRNLLSAVDTLEKSGMRGLHRGPYSGNSNG
jgi:hypothetical protein